MIKFFVSGALAAVTVVGGLGTMPLVQAQVTSTTSSSTRDLESDPILEVLPVTSAGNDTAPRVSVEQIPGTDIQIGDFVVGPGKVEVSVAPGQTVVREITLTNRIDANRTFDFLIEDMSGSANGSEAVVLLGDQNGPYSLKDYISLPSKRITLGLGERARIPVSITMPENAEPGGYYGAVLAATVQDDGNESGSIARSPIVARIGTLFFITVPGETNVAGDLIDFSTIAGKTWFTAGPINFGITYENTGSVHLNPYGEIRIKNIFGNEVGFVELDPWFVLPKSLRTREVAWNSPFLLGFYSVTATINRGYDDIIDTKKTYVVVLPWIFLLTVFSVVFLTIFVIRLFFSRFEFKRK